MLPGVGPVTAQANPRLRDEHGSFASVDELDGSPGIGPTRLEQLRELVTVRARSPESPLHIAAGSFCAGLSLALAAQVPAAWLAAAALALAGVAAIVPRRRVELVALGLAAGGWWLGSVRLEEMDRSVLVAAVGQAAPATLEVRGPARTSQFTTRLPLRVKVLWRQLVDRPRSSGSPRRSARRRRVPSSRPL